MSSLADLITDRLQPALAALLIAFDYAADSGLDRWEFALEMTELLREPSGTVPFCGALGTKGDCPLRRGRFADQRPRFGATIADLRWLIRRGLAEHAKETTIPGDPARTFRPLPATSFPPDACLSLTLLGAVTLRPIVARRGLSPFAESAQQKGTVPFSAPSAEFPESEIGNQIPEVSLAGSLASRTADGDRRAPQNGSSNAVVPRPPDHAESPSPSTGEGRGEGATPQNGNTVVARSPDHAAAHSSPPSTSSGQAQSAAPGPQLRPKPIWHADLHELHFNGTLIKRFRNPARNQELILAAFEEEGWPKRIDDPLPPTGDLDPRQRLRNTIVTLNRHQLTPVLHFRCDGTGRGVQWEPTRESPEVATNRAKSRQAPARS